MIRTLAFDVYGTLVDPLKMAEQLETELGKNASGFVALWRAKQLEYSFRRALMKRYVSFSVCTAQALQFAAAQFHWPLSAQRERQLLDAYRHLPAFPDATIALPRLATDHTLFAFSNGTSDDVDAVLTNAGLRDNFAGIISVETTQSFKPDPAVYAHARQTAGATETGFALVSSNAWDVIGARSAGIDAFWIRRTDTALFDPWEFEPTATVESLSKLERLLAGS